MHPITLPSIEAKLNGIHISQSPRRGFTLNDHNILPFDQLKTFAAMPIEHQVEFWRVQLLYYGVDVGALISGVRTAEVGAVLLKAAANLKVAPDVHASPWLKRAELHIKAAYSIHADTQAEFLALSTTAACTIDVLRFVWTFFNRGTSHHFSSPTVNLINLDQPTRAQLTTALTCYKGILFHLAGGPFIVIGWNQTKVQARLWELQHPNNECTAQDLESEWQDGGNKICDCSPDSWDGEEPERWNAKVQAELEGMHACMVRVRGVAEDADVTRWRNQGYRAEQEPLPKAHNDNVIATQQDLAGFYSPPATLDGHRNSLHESQASLRNNAHLHLATAIHLQQPTLPVITRTINGATLSLDSTTGFTINNHKPLSLSALFALASTPTQRSTEFWLAQFIYCGLDVHTLIRGITQPELINSELQRAAANYELLASCRTPDWIAQAVCDMKVKHELYRLTQSEFLALSPTAACIFNAPRFVWTCFSRGPNHPEPTPTIDLIGLDYHTNKSLKTLVNSAYKNVLFYSDSPLVGVLGWEKSKVDCRLNVLMWAGEASLGDGDGVHAEVKGMRACVERVKVRLGIVVKPHLRLEAQQQQQQRENVHQVPHCKEDLGCREAVQPLVDCQASMPELGCSQKVGPQTTAARNDGQETPSAPVGLQSSVDSSSNGNCIESGLKRSRDFGRVCPPLNGDDATAKELRQFTEHKAFIEKQQHQRQEPVPKSHPLLEYPTKPIQPERENMGKQEQKQQEQFQEFQRFEEFKHFQEWQRFKQWQQQQQAPVAGSKTLVTLATSQQSVSQQPQHNELVAQRRQGQMDTSTTRLARSVETEIEAPTTSNPNLNITSTTIDAAKDLEHKISCGLLVTWANISGTWRMTTSSRRWAALVLSNDRIEAAEQQYNDLLAVKKIAHEIHAAWRTLPASSSSARWSRARRSSSSWGTSSDHVRDATATPQSQDAEKSIRAKRAEIRRVTWEVGEREDKEDFEKVKEKGKKVDIAGLGGREVFTDGVGFWVDGERVGGWRVAEIVKEARTGETRTGKGEGERRRERVWSVVNENMLQDGNTNVNVNMGLVSGVEEGVKEGVEEGAEERAEEGTEEGAEEGEGEQEEGEQEQEKPISYLADIINSQRATPSPVVKTEPKEELTLLKRRTTEMEGGQSKKAKLLEAEALMRVE